jgi:hypothetical protein
MHRVIMPGLTTPKDMTPALRNHRSSFSTPTVHPGGQAAREPAVARTQPFVSSCWRRLAGELAIRQKRNISAKKD